MPAAASEMLVGASSDFLTRFSPFNRMEPEALEFLAARATLAFHARGSEILTPEMGQPTHFHIVQRGKVQARQLGPASVTDYAAMTLGPGECFPIGAISAQRPSTNAYVAVEDSFVFQLPAEDFLKLMQMSPVFHVFCTQYIASLLNQSRQQLQSTFAQRAAEQQTMTTPLGQLVKKAPIFVTPDSSIRAALEKMSEMRIGCMVITDADQKPLGILTQSDLLPRVVLPGIDLQRPIGDVMTATPHVMSASDSAYDAALEMATHGVRHLLVVDSEGRLQGVVSERDLFTLQRIGLRQIRSSIEGADDLEALQRASRDIRQLALNLIAQGIGAEQLTQFISALNDALTCRIIDLARAKHDLYGIDYAWLAFGSEGRHEQTLSSDQDNGIIYACPEGADQAALKSRLLACAKEVNENLAACGFPLCKGNIMASNPELCLTLDEWKGRFGDWIREPDPQALLNATIFFDYRVLCGNERLGDQLRAWLNRTAKAYSNFLRLMASNALQVAPPLGRIRDFVVEDDGTIDLKKSGARLFVDVARILALRADVASSSTVQRLRQAGTRMGMPAEEIAALIDGFHFIQLLRLRAQHLDTEHDAPGDNRIDPDTLNELDRRILKEAFRQARKLQLRLKLDYQL
ncbi:MAG: CBS domain-containing protein [Azoarcus sp.]|nr:CBS domain-containing protein [Azoarcus sp.]